MRAQRNGSRGYSLIELLVVMAIIGILSLITVPQFISFQRAGKMKSALRNFTMDLRTVRQKAITQNVWTRIEFQPAAADSAAARTYQFLQSSDRGVTWTALAMRGGFGGNTSNVIGQGSGNIKELEKAVFFSWTNFTDTDANGRIDITFLPNGTVTIPTPPANTPPPPAGSLYMRTLWNVRNNQITITISPSGQVHTASAHV